MALVVTTLNGAASLNATFVTLTAYTNPVSTFGAKACLVVDGETMLVTDASLSPTLQVARGYSSVSPSLPTLPACAHTTLAPVVYGLTTDFTGTASTDGRAGNAVISLTTNSTTVTLPVVDSTIYITKAGVLAITIFDPNKDQVNTIKMISLTANAHLITFTTSIYGNGASSDVITFPATVGAAITIQAKNGLWQAIATADDGATIG